MASKNNYLYQSVRNEAIPYPLRPSRSNRWYKEWPFTIIVSHIVAVALWVASIALMYQYAAFRAQKATKFCGQKTYCESFLLRFPRFEMPTKQSTCAGSGRIRDSCLLSRLFCGAYRLLGFAEREKQPTLERALERYVLISPMSKVHLAICTTHVDNDSWWWARNSERASFTASESNLNASPEMAGSLLR